MLSLLFILGATLLDTFEQYAILVFLAAIVCDVALARLWRSRMLVIFATLQVAYMVAGYAVVSYVSNMQDVAGPYWAAFWVGGWIAGTLLFHLIFFAVRIWLARIWLGRASKP